MPLAEETIVQGRRGQRQRQQRRPRISLPQLCLGDILTTQTTPSTINNQHEFQIFQIRESHSKNIALPVLFGHVKNVWLGMAYCQVLANLCTLLVGKETATLLERSQSPEPVREEGPLRDCERTPKLRSFFLKQTFYLYRWYRKGTSKLSMFEYVLCLNAFIFIGDLEKSIRHTAVSLLGPSSLVQQD